MSGLGVQIDGSHYTSMKMQPVELAYKVYGTPCFCKLAKYLTREKGDKLINLQKALHCIELERDLSQHADVYLDKLDGLVSWKEAQKLVNTFTDNIHYQDALMNMWIGNYEGAIADLEYILEEYEQ